MKKDQVKKSKFSQVAFTAAAMAVAGSVISTDAAAAECTSGTAASGVVCSFATGDNAPWSENWTFSGSNNVRIQYVEALAAFGACAFHNDGTKSFGQSLSSSTMAVHSATGGNAHSVSGCTS